MKVSRFRKFVSILRWLLLIPFRYFIEIEHIKGTKGLISSDGVLLSSYKSVESSYTMAKLNWVNSEGNFIKHRMGGVLLGIHIMVEDTLDLVKQDSGRIYGMKSS